jgi:hypothetical protein
MFGHSKESWSKIVFKVGPETDKRSRSVRSESSCKASKGGNIVVVPTSVLSDTAFRDMTDPFDPKAFGSVVTRAGAESITKGIRWALVLSHPVGYLNR